MNARHHSANSLSALIPQVPGAGQVRPAATPAVTTVTATVAAIRTFIQAATALRRSQARVPPSLGTEPALRAGPAAGSWVRSGVCGPAAGPAVGPTAGPVAGPAAGPAAGPVRSGASVVIPYPPYRAPSLLRRS